MAGPPEEYRVDLPSYGVSILALVVLDRRGRLEDVEERVRDHLPFVDRR